MAPPGIGSGLDLRGGEVFAVLLGRLVISWNRSEHAKRVMLATLLHDGASWVVVAELNQVGVDQALRSFANGALPEPIKSLTLQGITQGERLRAYRNHYVHGIVSTSGSEHGSEGHIVAHSAKNELKEHTERVPAAQIEEVAQKCEELADHFASLGSYLRVPPTERGDDDLPQAMSLYTPLTKPGKALKIESVLFSAETDSRAR